ncbi:MFS transporter [Virgibacillus oceani]
MRFGIDFTRLYSSMCTSAFAHTFGTFIISWFVYDLTGSELAMGSLWIINIGTQIFVQFSIGPYIDRFQRKSVMMVSESVRILAYILLLIISFTGHLNAGILYSVAFLTAVVVYDPPANALVPNLVKKDQLVKANAHIAGTVQFMRLIALPIAGLVVASFSIYLAVFMVVFLFLISILFVSLIQEHRQSNKMVGNNWWSQFKKGLAVYRKQKILIFLGFFIAVVNFSVFATQVMYIPYVLEVLDGTSFSYGLFAASFPLGYIIGSFIVGKLSEPSQRLMYILMIGALFIGGLTHVGLGLTTLLWAAIMIEVIAGIIMPVWNIYCNTLFQKLVPDDIRGQVFTVRFIFSKIATPLGIIYGTFWAISFTLPTLFLSVGILTCVLTAVGVMSLGLYYLKRPETEEKIS